MQTERDFRRINCLKCLQTLHSLAMQYAHFTIAKGKHAKGIKAVTRADTQAQRLQSKIDQVRWEYSHSRARLKDLGMTPQDIKTFQPFCANDVQDLKQMALKHDSLVSGQLILPWYWRVSLAEEGSSSSLHISATDVAAEYEESKQNEPLAKFLDNQLLRFQVFVYNGSVPARDMRAGRKKWSGYNTRLPVRVSTLPIAGTHGYSKPIHLICLDGQPIVITSPVSGELCCELRTAKSISCFRYTFLGVSEIHTLMTGKSPSPLTQSIVIRALHTSTIPVDTSIL
jgi:hypothetical protein